MTLGAGTLGSGVLGASGADKVVEAINWSKEIPDQVKSKLTEYIKETFNDLWDTLSDLLELQPPTDLMEHWDLLIEIVQRLMG